MGFTNPYDILGISRDSTLEQVKTQYMSLARKHHPDKHMSESEEVRKEHEEEFKRVCLAYKSITEGGNFSFNSSTEVNWSELWTLFSKKETIDMIKKIIKNTIHDVVINWPSKITVAVPLEDIHLKRVRKVKVKLSNKLYPIEIDCSLKSQEIYINTGFDTSKPLIIEVTASPHPVFYRSDLFSEFDLYTKVDVGLDTYFFGKTIELPYLDGTILPIIVPPFYDSSSITLEGYGLQNIDNLIVSLNRVLPDKERFELFYSGMDEYTKRAFRSFLCT